MLDFHGKGAGFKRDLISDVQDMMARMLSGVSATIAAQQDGASVSDQHRVLNFQGPGVAVTDDSVSRRTNIYIPGAPTSSSAINAPSAITSKALSLWNTGTGSNNAPPTNWQTTGFNDTGWGSATVWTGGASNPVSGSTGIWYHSTADPAVGGAALFRTHFTLPVGSVASATLTFLADSTAPGVYVNGTFIASQTFYDWTGPLVPYVYTISSSLLVTGGGDNVIAVWVVNDSGDLGGGVAYRMTVNMAGAGTDSRYQLLSEKGAANGYAGLGAGGLVPTNELGTGSASSTTFLRGDQSWAAASTNAVTVKEVDGTPNVSATTVRFPNGTLTDDGGGQVTYTPIAGTGSGSGFNALASDVTMTNANQFYDGPSLSLTAGTWLLVGTVSTEDSGGASTFTARLWDGTTTAATSHQAVGTLLSTQVSVSAVVTLASSATWKISVACNQAGRHIRAAASVNSAGNNASCLSAVRVA